MALTDKQEAFCQEYLVDLNATQAAIRAKYSERTAQEQASRLLSNVMVQERISELMAERAERTQITQDRVLKELALIGFYNPERIITVDSYGHPRIDLTTATEDDFRVLTKFKSDSYWEGEGDDAKLVKKCEIAISDKQSALEKIGRHLGMWKDKVEVDDKRRPKFDNLTVDELLQYRALQAKVEDAGGD